MERDGHVTSAPDGRDRRSRLVMMTDLGRHVWLAQALPKIHAYYEQILAGRSIDRDDQHGWRRESLQGTTDAGVRLRLLSGSSPDITSMH